MMIPGESVRLKAWNKSEMETHTGNLMKTHGKHFLISIHTACKNTLSNRT
jgi:hypothetical protein